jgi:hypothetical protein
MAVYDFVSTTPAPPYLRRGVPILVEEGLGVSLLAERG